MLDGEAIVTNERGLAVFDLIRHKRHGAEAVLLAFDLTNWTAKTCGVLQSSSASVPMACAKSGHNSGAKCLMRQMPERRFRRIAAANIAKVPELVRPNVIDSIFLIEYATWEGCP
jgi:hypothetical protein